MNKELQEQIARGAATTWCRCHKCNKILRDSNNLECRKPNSTCNQWYHAYRGALLAFGDQRCVELFNDSLMSSVKELLPTDTSYVSAGDWDGWGQEPYFRKEDFIRDLSNKIKSKEEKI